MVSGEFEPVGIAGVWCLGPQNDARPLRGKIGSLGIEKTWIDFSGDVFTLYHDNSLLHRLFGEYFFYFFPINLKLINLSKPICFDLFFGSTYFFAKLLL